MPIEIARQNIAAAAAESPVGAEVMDDVHGQYRGQSVQAVPQTSKLLEAAEEIESAVASRGGLRQRNIREERGTRGGNVQALARARGEFDDLPDLPGEVQTQSLADQISAFQELFASDGGADGRQPTADDILALLQDFDPDVTHQFAALEILRSYAEDTGADPRLTALLDEARATFDRADVMREVRAGRAAAEVASQAAATLETDPAAVRDTYRAMVRDAKHLGQLFDALRRFDVLKSFTAILDTFTAAAGRDLASTGPSADPDLLDALLKELGKLKRMRTTIDAVAHLVAVTERTEPRSQRGAVNVADQASLIMHFAAGATAGPGDARRMLGAFAPRRLATQIVYATGLRMLHGELSDEVVPSLGARLQQNTAILGLLDALVAAEEAALAAGA